MFGAKTFLVYLPLSPSWVFVGDWPEVPANVYSKYITQFLSC